MKSFAWLIFFIPSLLSAHGDLHLQILKMDEQIKAVPKSPRLWCKRADLKRYHEEYPGAEADYLETLKLDPGYAEADYGLACLYLDWNKASSGMAPIERYLAARPGDEKGLGIKGRLLQALGRHAEAAKAFSQALKTGSNSSVEYYMERAQALVQAGNPEEALAALDAGSARLGGLVVLDEAALEIERGQKHFENALRRNARLLRAARRKESRLLVQGEILKSLGREAEAKEAWKQALEEMAKLPEQRRYVQAMKDLEAKLKGLLKG